MSHEVEKDEDDAKCRKPLELFLTIGQTVLQPFKLQQLIFRDALKDVVFLRTATKREKREKKSTRRKFCYSEWHVISFMKKSLLSK